MIPLGRGGERKQVGKWRCVVERESSEETSVIVEMFDEELVIELVLEKLKVSDEEQTM